MLEVVSQGFVHRRDPAAPRRVAAGPRCAVLPDGELLCSFMIQSGLGVNDFVPVLARSAPDWEAWSEPAPLFPHLAGTQSLFGAIGPGRPGEHFVYGIRIPIDAPGESFWTEATQGMKQNALFWSRSPDGGRTWTEPADIPLDGPGSAEAPCALTVTRGGRWIACYAPYNTFDPGERVDRGRVVVALSDSEGAAWRHRDALRFAEPDSGGAEAWVIELSGGELLATAWHVDHSARRHYPNAYAMSSDGGETWSPTRSTGIQGQSTALAALPGGRALLIYNQRKHGRPGVYLAVVKPTPESFGVEHDQMIWAAPSATQHATSADHSEWTDFSFGEPHVTILPDGTLFAVFWCIEGAESGIRYVRLKAAGLG